MVNAVYILKVDEKVGDSIYEILNLVTSRTQYKPGCLQAGIWRNDERSELMLYEIWNSKVDLEKHITSALYKRLLVALEMSTEKPVVRFSECDKVNGIEVIEEVMANHKTIS
jgi:quinol monooxygenase YgiN